MDDFLYPDAFANEGSLLKSTSLGDSSFQQHRGEHTVTMDDILSPEGSRLLDSYSGGGLGVDAGSDAMFSRNTPCPFSEQPMNSAHAIDLSGLTSTAVSDSSSISPASLYSLVGSPADFGGFSDLSASDLLPALAQQPPAPLSAGLSSQGAHTSSIATPLDANTAAAQRCRQKSHKAKGSGSNPQRKTPAGTSADEYRTSQEYFDKRARNNAAVRKSRIKAKQKSKETEEEVQDLRLENEELKRSLNALRDQLETLRALQPTLFEDEDDI